MSERRDNARITVVIVFGFVLVEVAAFAGIAPPWGGDPNTIIRSDPNQLAEIDSAWEDRHAEEIYRTQGAEIVARTQETSLPSPDNAALLYYQAFLLRPEPDDTTYMQIQAVHAGGEPDSHVRIYLGKCRKMIHTAEVASMTPQCTWGIRHLDREGFSEMFLLADIRQLALVLALDARTLGADGHYDAAFARCLTLRRVARHVGDDTILAYLVARAADDLARRAMQHVLGLTPPDADTFARLRGQLAAMTGTSPSFEIAMQGELNIEIERIRNVAQAVENLRQGLAEAADSQQARKEALRLTDNEVLALTRESWERYLHGVFQVIDSDVPYEQKYAEVKEWTTSAGHQPSVFAGDTTQRWNITVRDTAAYNALKTAVEIYLAGAETGQLPQALPAGSPKDPFSGQEFEYEVTPNGFVLRCRAEDLHENRTWQYEFTVRR